MCHNFLIVKKNSFSLTLFFSKLGQNSGSGSKFNVFVYSWTRHYCASTQQVCESLVVDLVILECTVPTVHFILLYSKIFGSTPPPIRREHYFYAYKKHMKICRFCGRDFWLRKMPWTRETSVRSDLQFYAEKRNILNFRSTRNKNVRYTISILRKIW